MKILISGQALSKNIQEKGKKQVVTPPVILLEGFI